MVCHLKRYGLSSKLVQMFKRRGGLSQIEFRYKPRKGAGLISRSADLSRDLRRNDNKEDQNMVFRSLKDGVNCRLGLI